MSIEKQLEMERDLYSRAFVALNQSRRNPVTDQDYLKIAAEAQNVSHYAKMIALSLQQIESDITP
jgi:hypothetical protein